MFIAALSTIAKSWKKPKCPSMDEWIRKMWFICTMDYYLAMRKNEIWPFVAMWMELKGIMLSEIRLQRKADTICFHSYVDLEKLNRRPWGRGRRKNKLQRGREANHKRLLNTEIRLRVDGGVGKGENG